MAKETGLAWSALSIDDSGGTLRDIRNDITNFNFATTRAVQDVTGIDKSAIERLPLLIDFSIQMTGVFNDAANASHDVFKTVPSSTVAREFSLIISGQTLGTTPQAAILLTDYVFTRPQTGEATWQVPGVLANGVVPTWT